MPAWNAVPACETARSPHYVSMQVSVVQLVSSLPGSGQKYVRTLLIIVAVKKVDFQT